MVQSLLMSDSQEKAGFVAPEPADLAPLFPVYDIQGLIATGGMGAVYCAVQKSLDRTVALKILPMEFSKDAAFCAGFEAEAKAMAKLNHPNLIGVYDFGEVDGMLFIIMEYVPGKSLYHSAYGRTIDPQEAIRLVTGICNGLGHAHENGIIHRDIKPSNILLDLNAEPKIGDFGLARPMDRKFVEGEEIFGTPHYTAPEVVNSPHSVDYRADIFSVGVLLHELLTGKLPADDTRPTSVIARCDTRFDAIIRKATQQLPAARYANARDMAKDLQAIGSSFAPKAVKMGSPKGPTKVVRGAAAAAPRTPTTTPKRRATYSKAPAKKSSNPTVTVFVIAAILAAAAVYFMQSRNPPPPPPKPKVKVIPVGGGSSNNTLPWESHKSPPDKPTPVDKTGISEPDNGSPGRRLTNMTIEPDEAGPAPETIASKSDVPAFFERARKIMRDKANPVGANLKHNLAMNFTGFENSFRNRARKFIASEGFTTPELDAVFEKWEGDGQLDPAEVDQIYTDIPEIQALVSEYTRKMAEVVAIHDQEISKLNALYIVGLEKQIERLKADNDVGAIELIQQEIDYANSDRDYFSKIVLALSATDSE
jgi:serine/threonine protein kinase